MQNLQSLRNIPPRLARLLDILSLADAPAPVAQLAKRCGVSRRTIFREISNIDALLEPYGLGVGTKAGEGIYLSGAPEGKEKLRAALTAESSAFLAGLAGLAGLSGSAGRSGRRAVLALDLLTLGEAQKLSYYADVFNVSEATVSYDLNSLDDKLRRYGVGVARKPGRGVTVEGGEAAVRGAICALILEAKRSGALFAPALGSLGCPPPDIADGVNELADTRFKHQLAWMTEESREAFTVYMAVAVARVASGCEIEEPGTPTPAENPSDLISLSYTSLPFASLPFADFLANSLELRFSVVLSEWERKNLALYLSALRKAANVLGAPGEAANDFLLKSLAYQMIEHFDPALSPFLKLDDRLVEGLALHMQSAVVRIKNRIELYDPLYDEIARAYPDILEKSRRSLDALRIRQFSVGPAGSAGPANIPESEASFLATHFGAGVMRMREHARRRLRVAVVCGGGIGTSYFLLSRLKKHFAAQAEFEICGLSDVEDAEEWKRFDLCVTSVPLSGIPIPAVRVNLLLEEADAEAVRLRLESLSAPERRDAAAVKDMPLLELCGNAAAVLSDVQALLTHFDTIVIESDCDFDRLAKLAGYRFGLEHGGKLIYDDIIRRENMSTQVVPSLELILLHTRTEGVKNPVFALIVPEKGRFTSAALQNSRCCVVMLAPLKASRDTLTLMGRISSALLEDAAFLGAVLDADKEKIFRRLEENFRDYLAANITFRMAERAERIERRENGNT